MHRRDLGDVRHLRADDQPAVPGRPVAGDRLLRAPLGFAFGTPIGARLGTTFDWRWSFGALTAVGVVVLALIAAAVPDHPGSDATARLSPRRVFAIPGVAVVLVVIATWMLAHTTIYTYLAPFLREGGTGLAPGLVLFLYGVASLGGIGLTGLLIDRRPGAVLRSSVALFIAAGAVLLVGHASVAAVLVGTALWGLAFGGASAQLQAALTHVRGENADDASPFLPVAFNVVIFAAGLLGAGLLAAENALLPAGVMVVLGVVALLLVMVGRRTAFTASR